MMKSEFIERTGFEPTEAEYREIEAEYMGCDIDKDEFCKTWKKQGGIQRLMRLRARRIEELEAELVKEKNDHDRMDAQYCEKINRLNDEKNSELNILKHDNEVLKSNQKRIADQLVKESERANEAERKLAVLKEAFAIITGKEAE
ncbi:hypothetical protein [Roseburia intestinalis]|uniref:hypothetical protein n=1 Tax=Roseburia intestinalis TaxID=166486 RepID=UPI00156EDBDE|nr:hypothetical protein [Roseburia intestinalis]NSC34812.1 hypothetical protein [Roseburia intestinalis]